MNSDPGRRVVSKPPEMKPNTFKYILPILFSINIVSASSSLFTQRDSEINMGLDPKFDRYMSILMSKTPSESRSLSPTPRMKSVLVGGRKSQKIEPIPLGVDPLSVETEFVDLNRKDEAYEAMDTFYAIPEKHDLNVLSTVSGTSVDEVKETKVERPKSVLGKIADGFRALSPKRDRSEIIIKTASSGSGKTDQSSIKSPSQSPTNSSSSKDSVDSSEDQYFRVISISREPPPMLNNRRSSLFRLPSRLSTSSVLRTNPVVLPRLHIPDLFSDPMKVNFDNIVAMALYGGPHDNFQNILDDHVNGLAGGLLPLSRYEPNKSLIKDGVEQEVMTSESLNEHVAWAVDYINRKYKDNLELFKVLDGIENASARDEEYLKALYTNMDDQRAQDRQEFRCPDHTKAGIINMLIYTLGKGSTKSDQFSDKLCYAVQRLLVTPRDIFYYPGMLKLALFFKVEFDGSFATDFFDQFINSFYSGAYGPRRKDLFYITRFEDIPESVLPDSTLTKSVVDGEIRDTPAARNIADTKASFLNAKNRELFLKTYGPEQLGYRELNPVPKTIDDVLEATKMILRKYWRVKRIHNNKHIDIDGLVYNQTNVDHMRSFYMDIFKSDYESILRLFTTLILDFGHNLELRNHSASFLYAAFIEILRTHQGRGYEMTVGELEEKMREMFAMDINPKAFEEIHRQSVRVADVDLSK